MELTKDELKIFYDNVWLKNGWDFSKVRSVSKGEKWNFYGEVKKRSVNSDRLLDIGTGGGENMQVIAKNYKYIIGIDISESMVNTAKKNLLHSGLDNVVFFVMDAGDIQFPD